MHAVAFARKSDYQRLDHCVDISYFVRECTRTLRMPIYSISSRFCICASALRSTAGLFVVVSASVTSMTLFMMQTQPTFRLRTCNLCRGCRRSSRCCCMCDHSNNLTRDLLMRSITIGTERDYLFVTASTYQGIPNIRHTYSTCTLLSSCCHQWGTTVDTLQKSN